MFAGPRRFDKERQRLGNSRRIQRLCLPLMRCSARLRCRALPSACRPTTSFAPGRIVEFGARAWTKSWPARRLLRPTRLKCDVRAGGARDDPGISGAKATIRFRESAFVSIGIPTPADRRTLALRFLRRQAVWVIICRLISDLHRQARLSTRQDQGDIQQ